MEGRLANMWRLTLSEKKFVETALLSELRIDGRGFYDYRKLTIKFGKCSSSVIVATDPLPLPDCILLLNKEELDDLLFLAHKEDGSSEVQLGQTHVMGFVTAQLLQPYKDRPNEGTLSIFTEFSPMADPSFEPGRPSESAVELGRIIDRGLRESRAMDTESLCVLAGKLVWAVRIDLHILDNGGNLVDAANIAALAALLTFRRPECTLGGEDGQEVIIHPPEEREPVPLMVHHLPIAFTFGFFNNDSIVVMDPTYIEESVMGGRMTVTVNANGDICAIQKPGEEGVAKSVILHCLRLASSRAAATTKIIKEAVEVHNRERALQKVKRNSISAKSGDSGPTIVPKERQTGSSDQDKTMELSRKHVERLKLSSEGSGSARSTDEKKVVKSSEQKHANEQNVASSNFMARPSSWDPYAGGANVDTLRASLASQGDVLASTPSKKQKDSGSNKKSNKNPSAEAHADVNSESMLIDESQTTKQRDGVKTLKDAVKPKNKRKKRHSSATS